MDKCREAFEKNRFWIGIFKADVVFKSEIGEFGLYEALNSKVEAEYLVEFNNKWVIWYQCWKSRQAEVEQLKCENKKIHGREIKKFEENLILKAEIEEKDKRIETLIMIWRNQAKELCNVDDKHVREALLSCADELEVMRANNANS
ncbi:hypothetical protein AS4_28840 [Acinetobacter guillouiae]|uniref:hypothetical protein n=1 Tax=Acinetobacter guillouiae TaxID=106649 RepID=UPI0004EF6250|nr:hypothetical protein [Acinetobacter guillouiae]BAP37824.1 hypothetical protein AS4_28840 [Acinetobacter guillouiae]